VWGGEGVGWGGGGVVGCRVGGGGVVWGECWLGVGGGLGGSVGGAGVECGRCWYGVWEVLVWSREVLV